MRINLSSPPTNSLGIFLLLILGAGSVAAQNNQKDSEAKIISAPPFTLSAEAQAAGIDGSLRIYVTVSKDGSVKSAEVVAGFSWPCGESPKKAMEDVRETIKKILMEAKFKPATKNSEPVSQDLVLTFAIGETYRKAQREKEMQDASANGKVAPATVSGGVLNGKAIKLPKPVYPPQAHSSRAGGAVSIQVLIDETGKIIRAGAVSGHPLLQDAARDAACSAKFSPTLLQGNPVKVSGIITYNFVP